MMMNVWCLVHITCIAVQRALHIPFHRQQEAKLFYNLSRLVTREGGVQEGPREAGSPVFGSMKTRVF